MGEMLRKSQLAKRWNVSKGMVTKIFKRPGAPAFDAEGRIDADLADEWRACGLARGGCGPAAGRVAPAPKDGPAKTPQASGCKLPSIAESRQRQEAYKARALELDVKQKEGELIPLADAVDRARQDAAIIRSTMLAMPARLAPSIADAAGNPSAVVAVSSILEQWARATLADFARMMEE